MDFNCLAWFAAIITAVQETMEKTSKKIVQKDNDSTADVNGNQEAFVQNMQEQNGILDSKDVNTRVHSFTSIFLFLTSVY